MQVCLLCSAGALGGARCGVRSLGLPGESRCLGLKAGLEGSTRPANALTEEKVGVCVCVCRAGVGEKELAQGHTGSWS